MHELLKKIVKAWKSPAWFDADERQAMFDASVDRAGTAYFGFKRFRASDKVQAVLSHFNRVAPKYDFMNSVLSLGIHHAWKRKAIRMLALKPGDQIIDVCGGTGDLAVLGAKHIGKAGKVFLYDINRAMMEAGQLRPENRAHSAQIRYIQGDAERIACRDNQFDVAMVGFGIRNLTHLKKGFMEMYRVLKPGGKILCLEFSKPVNPVFRWLYDFYSFNIMPVAGALLAGSSQSYACLSETIRMFASPAELQTILEGIGFESVFYSHLTNGIAVIHLGRKPLRG
jgi:demethylmenaquinone methyltransferase/2-methoxy-6-polyprenyl-1,4-benzoquinol methylase